MKNEQLTTAANIIEEIQPLMVDYFEGIVAYEKGKIFYTMPNGQKFIILAMEA